MNKLWLLLTLLALSLFSQSETVFKDDLFQTHKSSRNFQFALTHVSLFDAPDYQIALDCGAVIGLLPDDWKRMQEFGKKRGFMIDDPGINGTIPDFTVRKPLFKAVNQTDLETQ